MARRTVVPGTSMLNGTVKTIAITKGFGFLAGEDGREYFFHKSETPDFDALDRGVAVTFLPGSGPKGPRAELVQLA
jgi:CspA family cold shock protein